MLVGAVGWLTNAGMNEFLKKQSVAVRGKAVSGFSVCLTEAEKIVELPRGCSSMAIDVASTHPNFGSTRNVEHGSPPSPLVSIWSVRSTSTICR